MSSRKPSSSMSNSLASYESWPGPSEDKKRSGSRTGSVSMSRKGSASTASSTRMKRLRKPSQEREVRPESAPLQCHGLDLPVRPNTTGALMDLNSLKRKVPDDSCEGNVALTAVKTQPTLCTIGKPAPRTKDVGIQVDVSTREQRYPRPSSVVDLLTTPLHGIHGSRSDANLTDTFFRAMKEKKPFSWHHHIHRSGHNTPGRKSPALPTTGTQKPATYSETKAVEDKMLGIENKVDQLGPVLEKLTGAIEALTSKVDSAINSPPLSRYTSTSSTTNQNGYTSFWREKQQVWSQYRRPSGIPSSTRPSMQSNLTATQIDELESPTESPSRTGAIRVMHKADVSEDDGHISVEELLVAPPYRQRQMSRWDTETEEDTDHTNDSLSKRTRKRTSTHPEEPSAPPSYTLTSPTPPPTESTIAARRRASGTGARQLTAIKTRPSASLFTEKLAQVLPDLSSTESRPSLSLVLPPLGITLPHEPVDPSTVVCTTTNPSPRDTAPISPLALYPFSQPSAMGPATPAYYFFHGQLNNPHILSSLLCLSHPPIMKPAYVRGFKTKYYGTYRVAVQVSQDDEGSNGRSKNDDPSLKIEGSVFFAHTPEMVGTLRCYGMYYAQEVSTDIVLLEDPTYRDERVLEGRMFIWREQVNDESILTDGPAI